MWFVLGVRCFWCVLSLLLLAAEGTVSLGAAALERKSGPGSNGSGEGSSDPLSGICRSLGAACPALCGYFGVKGGGVLVF